MKRLVALAAVAVVALPRAVAASGPIGVGTPIEGPPPVHVGLEPGSKRAYWAGGSHRFFASSIVDAGYLYLRPQIALGFGKPHWHFVQAEAFATFSGGGVGQYGGLRLALPHVELRGGARYQLTFDRSFYVQRERYDRFALEERLGPPSRYVALELELIASAPLGSGSIFAVASAFSLRRVPAGFDVYEEQLRVMARPSEAFRARLGYALRLGRDGAIRFGPIAELVLLPARGARIVRGGVVATVVLNHHLEALATFVPVLSSPDSIGLAGGDFGQLGIRYRWGTPVPESE